MKGGRRAQLAGQIFLYILGIITVGLLLMLGLRAVQHLEQSKCGVESTRFATDLAAAIEKDKAWGVSRVEEFTLPCNSKGEDATEVCFISRVTANQGHVDPPVLNGMLDPNYLTPYGVIVDSVEAGVHTNVFLKFPSGFAPVTRFEISAPIDLPADRPITCVAGQPARIRFKGKGQGVEVEDAGDAIAGNP